MFSKAFEALCDPVVVTDDRGHILYVNKMAESSSGYTSEEAYQKSPGEFWGGHMPRSFYDRLWHTIKDEKRPFVGEIKSMTKDGHAYWQELRITPILDRDGEVRFFIAIEPLIAERKEHEHRKDEAIAIVSHQLKNPMATDRLMLEFLLNDDSLSDAHRESLTELYQNNLEMCGLINDLFAYAGVSAGHDDPETVDLVKEIARIVVVTQKKHPLTHFEFESDGLFPIQVSRTLATQILHNIISNAAEYSDALHGTVQLQLSRVPEGYFFSCRDNGIGIPQREQKRIFSRAFRATNAKRVKKNGTGLGLYITKMIADGLDWCLCFESSTGQGTTFFIQIPVANGTSSQG